MTPESRVLRASRGRVLVRPETVEAARARVSALYVADFTDDALRSGYPEYFFRGEIVDVGLDVKDLCAGDVAILNASQNMRDFEVFSDDGERFLSMQCEAILAVLA